MTTRERKQPKPIGAYLTWGTGGAAGLTVWALDTFTVQGFLSALYLAPTEEGMWWPTGTRIVWWVLFYAAASAWTQRLMWREAVLSFTSPVKLWAASHVDLVKRVARRVRWWSAGVRVVIEARRRHRPAVAAVPARVPERSRTVPGTTEATPAAA